MSNIFTYWTEQDGIKRKPRNYAELWDVFKDRQIKAQVYRDQHPGFEMPPQSAIDREVLKQQIENENI